MTAVVNRLGSRALTFNGVNFNYIANDLASNSSETLGTIAFGAGLSTFNITPGGNGSNTITLGTETINSGAAVLYSSPQAFVSAPAANSPFLSVTGAAVTNGLLTTAGQRQMVLNTGVGPNTLDYATLGTGTAIVAYSAYNNSGAYTDINSSAVAATHNIRIGTGFIPSGPASAVKSTALTVNSLDIVGANQTIGAGAGFSTLTLTAPGILVSGGTGNQVLPGLVINAGAVEANIAVADGSSLDFQGALLNTSNVQKNLPGLLTFSQHTFNITANTTYVNGGTLKLNAGLNTLNNPMLFSVAGAVSVNPGATLDLNGNAQVAATLSTAGNAGIQPTTGYITTSTGTGTLVANQGGASVFSGVIGQDPLNPDTTSNALNLAVSGTVGNTLTLNNAQGYTGFTLLTGAGLTLRSAATLATSGIDVNGGTLTLDNQSGLSDNTNRIPDAVVTNLRSGGFTLTGRAAMLSSETLGTLNLAQGSNTITINPTALASSLGSVTLNITTLGRTNSATVSFTTGSGTLGQLTPGVNVANPFVFIGSGFNQTGGIVPWATIGGADFATYNPTVGVFGLSAAGGAGYSGNNLVNTNSTADNISIAASPSANLNATNVNSLRITAAATVTMNAGQTLTLGSGGLLLNNASAIITGGNLTSGASELFLQANAAATINSAITGPLTLVKGLTGAVTLGGVNTYSNGTVINAGTVTLATTGSLGTGGITVNSGGTLTQTAGGLNTGLGNQALTLNGGAVVTVNNITAVQNFTGVTFNNYGGGATVPTLTIAAGGNLAIGSGGLSASASNIGTIATIATGTHRSLGESVDHGQSGPGRVRDGEHLPADALHFLDHRLGDLHGLWRGELRPDAHRRRRDPPQRRQRLHRRHQLDRRRHRPRRELQCDGGGPGRPGGSARLYFRAARHRHAHDGEQHVALEQRRLHRAEQDRDERQRLVPRRDQFLHFERRDQPVERRARSQRRCAAVDGHAGWRDHRRGRKRVGQQDRLWHVGHRQLQQLCRRDDTEQRHHSRGRNRRGRVALRLGWPGVQRRRARLPDVECQRRRDWVRQLRRATSRSIPRSPRPTSTCSRTRPAR